jgi:hypothetical protein
MCMIDIALTQSFHLLLRVRDEPGSCNQVVKPRLILLASAAEFRIRCHFPGDPLGRVTTARSIFQVPCTSPHEL